MLKIMLKKFSDSLNQFFKNIPFMISGISIGLLVFSAINNFKSLVIFLIAISCMCIGYNFDISYLKKENTVYKFIVSFVISALMYEPFYNSMLASSKIQIVATYFGIQIEILLSFITVLLCMFSMYFINFLICIVMHKNHLPYMLNECYKDLCEFRYLKRTFIILFCIYFIGISTIIRANVEYVDDMGRKALGYSGWGDVFYRYLSDILSKMINTGDYLADISPLTQLIAVILITASSTIIIVAFSGEKNNYIWNIIAVLPLGLNPYFINCFSYKFDSPYMALSIFGSLLPLLFYQYGIQHYIFMVIVGILTTCLTYQAGLGIFPVSVAVLSFEQWLKGKHVFKNVLYSIVGYISAIGIYYIFFMKKAEVSYVDTELLSLENMPLGIVQNLITYLSYVYSDFDIKWILLIGLILISFPVLVYKRKKDRVATVIALIMILFTYVFSFGPYIALKLPLFECRAMYGFGVCISIYAVVCISYKGSEVVKFSSACLSWCFLVFAFIYGNALEEQQRYVSFRMEMVLSDLNNLAEFNSDSTKYLQVNGSAGVSPIIEKMPQYDGALERMLKIYFDGDESWNSFYFFNYYDLKSVVMVTDLKTDDMSILSDCYYETIYGLEDKFIIYLKEY